MDPKGYLPIVVRVGMVVAQSSQMYACNYRDSMGMRLHQPPTKVGRQNHRPLVRRNDAGEHDAKKPQETTKKQSLKDVSRISHAYREMIME